MYIRLTNASTFLVLFLIVFVIGFILASPILTISALNTLFGLEIPVTFWTWLSMLWLHLILAVRTKDGNSGNTAGR